MSCRKRLTARLIGSLFVVLLGAGCAETGSPFSASSPQQADLVDHALNAAKAARAQGDLNGAAAKLAYLVSTAPDNTDVLAEYAKVLTELGRPDEALIYFRRAMARDPKDWKLYNAEAVAYDEKGNYAASADDYDTALKLMPGEAVVINNAARSRMAAGDLKGAEALLAQADPAARSQGFLAATQSHLIALEVAQTPAVTVASAAPQPIGKADTSAVAAETPVPAPVTPVVAQTAQVQTAAPPSPVSEPVKATPVAMNTATTWSPPTVPTTAPTTIDASQATPVAPPAPAQDVEPAQPSAAVSNEAAANSAASVVLPSIAPKEDAKVVAVADTKPAAPGAIQSQMAPNNAAPAEQADARRYFIRVGTFRSRRHARHVASRLRPREVHIARFVYRGRRYYRVWIASAGDRVTAENILQSVQALGYRHARVLARSSSQPARRLADAQK